MDNFCVPKIINRHVVKALSILQTTLPQLIFFPVESIVKQVELQMRRTKTIVNIEEYVHKSLCSLTRLGVVARVGPSDYALRQALQFSAGVSAIPWKTVPQVHYTVSSRSLVQEYIIFICSHSVPIVRPNLSRTPQYLEQRLRNIRCLVNQRSVSQL